VKDLKMKYSVDVKAFLRVVVEADSPEAAEQEAKAFVELLQPDANYVRGWAETRAEIGTGKGVVVEVGSIDTEDPAYIEDVDGNEIGEAA
jgi:hypothetical protein